MDMQKVCRNCHEAWREGDKYCRYCGAPMEHPDYIVMDFACIYGPEPVLRKHTCTKCRFSWKTQLMIDSERFCPKCGAEAATQEENRRRDFWGPF